MKAEDHASRSQRTSVMLSAHVYRVGRNEPTQHRITNLSETGVCLANSDVLRADSVVVLSIGQVEHVAADVKWVRGSLAGLAFREPIDLSLARMRRPDTGKMRPPSAGWLGELNDAYRR